MHALEHKAIHEYLYNVCIFEMFVYLSILSSVTVSRIHDSCHGAAVKVHQFNATVHADPLTDEEDSCSFALTHAQRRSAGW